jgi:carbamoyltransferase
MASSRLVSSYRVAAGLDGKSALSYHPRIGYTYTPNLKTRFLHNSGGFLIQTNASGFRSERAFTKERSPEVFRALLFGDSQTAGFGVNNRQRYSDRLEALVAGLEVFNYGIEAIGLDQEYLTYLENEHVEHDLVIIGLYVDDVMRVNSRYRLFNDSSGKEVYYAKPYYEFRNGKLILKHVPVPKQPLEKTELLENNPDAGNEAAQMRLYARAQSAFHKLLPSPAARRLLKTIGVHRLIQKVARIPRAPEYDTADNPGWRLLAEILKAWIHRSPTPVLLLPIPIWTFIDGSEDPKGYQARFRELAAATGCLLHDPLNDLRDYDPVERRKFFNDLDHLSPLGHEALAKSLAPVLARLVKLRQTERPTEALV